MGLKIHQLVGQAETLRRQVLATERRVESCAISFKARDALFHTLESNQQKLIQLEQRANTTTIDEFSRARIQTTLSGLDKRIVGLYGKIQDRAVANEVSDITKEAAALEATLQTGDVAEIAEAASHLDTHIETFTHDHALDRKEQRPAIAAARAAKQKADTFLQTHGFINQFNILEILPSESLRDEEIECDIVFELFEAAECFYNGKMQSGLRRFNQLGDDAKRRVRAHLAQLGEPSGDLLADPIKTARALIATGNDFADSHDGETYLGESKLKEFFTFE